MTTALYLTCALIWGTTWYGIRLSIGEHGVPTFFAATLRFAIATAVLWLLWLVTRVKNPAVRIRGAGWMAVCGLLNGFNYFLIYAAEEHISGAMAAVLYATLPLFTALLATLAHVEKVTTRDVGGAGIALLGIAILAGERHASSTTGVFGISLLLLSIFSCATYNVIFKKTAVSQHWLSGLVVFFSFTTIFLVVATLLKNELEWPRTFPPVAFGAILYLAIFGSVIAFAAYFALLRRISLMGAATLTFVQPIIALFVDAAFETEIVVGKTAYLGVLVILLGVAISRLIPRSRAAAEPID